MSTLSRDTRIELRVERRRDERGGRPRWSIAPPRPGHHADFANPWEFESFIRTAEGLRDFDVLLEAKAGDLALLRLRADLARYAAGVSSLLHPAERTI